MLALRLAKGARPALLCHRLILATATAGVGVLLLSALAYASGHPQDTGAGLLRLAWCVPPLGATAYLAMTVARVDPAAQAPAGYSPPALWPSRLPGIAATSAAMTAVLGSTVAFLVFLQLRGGVAGLPFHGVAADVFAADHPLPLAAALTLLAVAPLLAAAASAVAVRDRTTRMPVAAGWPWGAALMTAGVALGVSTASQNATASPALSGSLPSPGTETLGSWLLITAGVVMAAPGLTEWCGRALSAGRPGGIRLLSGRMLRQDAGRVGQPIGGVCAVAATALAMPRLPGGWPLGPLTVLGGALVLACAAAALVAAVAETRASRRGTAAILARMGAPRNASYRVSALRTSALLVAFGPLAWLVSQLMRLSLAG